MLEYLFWIGSIVAIFIAILFLIKYKAKEKQKKKELFRYNNFGHNFDLEKLVNEELKKPHKPIGTMFRWETKNKVSQVKIFMYLEDSLDKEKSIASNFSITHDCGSSFEDNLKGMNPYYSFYRKSHNGMHKPTWKNANKGLRSVEQALRDKAQYNAKFCIESYIEQYGTNTDNHMSGTVS